MASTNKLKWETLPPPGECSHPQGHKVEAEFQLGHEIPGLAICVHCGGIGEVMVMPRDTDVR